MLALHELYTQIISCSYSATKTLCFLADRTLNSCYDGKYLWQRWTIHQPNSERGSSFWDELRSGRF